MASFLCSYLIITLPFCQTNIPVSFIQPNICQHFISKFRYSPVSHLDEILPDFLSYALNSEMHQKQLLVIGETGSTRQALTKEDLKKHQVAFPSKEEQRRIIEKLDAASRKISELEDHYSTIYKECTELKRSILKVYFD